MTGVETIPNGGLIESSPLNNNFSYHSSKLLDISFNTSDYDDIYSAVSAVNTSTGNKVLLFEPGTHSLTGVLSCEDITLFFPYGAIVSGSGTISGSQTITQTLGDYQVYDSQISFEGVFNNSEVNVVWFGADAKTTAVSTSAVQSAFDYASLSYGGNDTVNWGYVGWYTVDIIFPYGFYICGAITLNNSFKRFNMKGIGRASIQSETGTIGSFAEKLLDGVVSQITVDNLAFFYFDAVFEITTDNADFSFHIFKKCFVAYCNIFLDQVSFSDSRSTSTQFLECMGSYGVYTFCKIYTDKSAFDRNWFTHDQNTIYMYINSFAQFSDNVWVPPSTGTSKAYIEFSSNDHTRSLKFTNERFGSETGSCPIVVVKNVNLSNVADKYRNQGIEFVNCFLSSNASYNPDAVGDVKGCVILSQTANSTLNAIQFIDFKSCCFTPDLNGGVVRTYNVVTAISTVLDSEFTINMDESSLRSATRGSNIPVESDLVRYVMFPVIAKKTFLHNKGTGKCTVIASGVAGKRMANLQYNRTYPDDDITTATYLVICVGNGDNTYGGIEYAYSSTYILTIRGYESAGTKYMGISQTKLHGTVGGVGGGANADIVSAHWGTVATGSATLAISGTDKIFDWTIAFGSNMETGNLYVRPLHDFSLLS